jgi:hypothetical protein
MKQALFIVLALMCMALGYLVMFKLAVKYVWPPVKQQVIEILQEGRK